MLKPRQLAGVGDTLVKTSRGVEVLSGRSLVQNDLSSDSVHLCAQEKTDQRPWKNEERHQQHSPPSRAKKTELFPLPVGPAMSESLPTGKSTLMSRSSNADPASDSEAEEPTSDAGAEGTARVEVEATGSGTLALTAVEAAVGGGGGVEVGAAVVMSW